MQLRVNQHNFSLQKLSFFKTITIGVAKIDNQYFILEQIDSNTDGLVDFEEFVAATLHVHQLVEHDTEKWKSLSQVAFDKFDFDGDGYITSDELRMVYFFIELPNFIVCYISLNCYIVQDPN